MPTYEEQQKALRAQVPQGTAGAEELARQGFADAGTQPINTSQPSPTQTQQSQDLFKVPTASKGPQGEQIFDVFGPQGHIADPSDPRLKGVDIAGLPTGQAPTGFKSKFETGFEQANQALGEQAQNVTGTQGSQAVQQYSPARRNDLASTFVQQDEIIGSMVKAFQDFSSPQNQRVSLRQTYDQMLKDSGIQAIDTELLDMKKVIEGTEDDLRTEITKAGGFATESQVLALTNARNKQLIKNYNQLIDLRNSKEKYLNTSIGLEQADRQIADQRFNSLFNMGVQITTMRQQMQQNARSQMQWLAEKTGFDGLYDATGGDPYYQSLVESTLGLPQGGLLTSANQARLARTRAQQEAALDLDIKRQQIKTPEEKALDTKIKNAQLKKLDAETKKIYSDIADEVGGKKKLTTEQYKALGFGSRLVQAGNIVNNIGDKFATTPTTPNVSIFGLNLTPGFLKTSEQKQFEQAKRNFINASLRRESGAVISPTEFEEGEKQYFPQLGDDAGTLEQKRQNRVLQTANFLREGGMNTVDPTKLTVSPSGELIELLD